MKKIFLIILATSLFSFNTASAQTPATKELDIGNGLVLKTSEAVFGTFVDNSTCDGSSNVNDYIITPPEFETIEKTIIRKPSYEVLEINQFDLTNRENSPSFKARVITIPEIAETIKIKRLKTQTQIRKRIIPWMCTPRTKRKIIEPATYSIYNKNENLIREFENAKEVMEFLNSR